MMNRKKNDNIDAVEMMRNIRDRLSKDYNKNPEKEEKDLIEIRRKYGLKSKVNIEH